MNTPKDPEQLRMLRYSNELKSCLRTHIGIIGKILQETAMPSFEEMPGFLEGPINLDSSMTQPRPVLFGERRRRAFAYITEDVFYHYWVVSPSEPLMIVRRFAPSNGVLIPNFWDVRKPRKKEEVFEGYEGIEARPIAHLQMARLSGLVSAPEA